MTTTRNGDRDGARRSAGARRSVVAPVAGGRTGLRRGLSHRPRSHRCRFPSSVRVTRSLSGETDRRIRVRCDSGTGCHEIGERQPSASIVHVNRVDRFAGLTLSTCHWLSLRSVYAPARAVPTLVLRTPHGVVSVKNVDGSFKPSVASHHKRAFRGLFRFRFGSQHPVRTPTQRASRLLASQLLVLVACSHRSIGTAADRIAFAVAVE